jgi:predicted PurR-regulated permease PerM
MNDPQTANRMPGRVGPESFWQRVPLKQVAMGTALVVLLVLGFALLIALRYVLLLLFLGIVVATALAPLVERLRRYGLPQGTAVLISCGLLLLLVVGVMVALVPFFAAQLALVADELPTRYASLRSALTASRSGFISNLATRLPTDPFGGLPGEEGIALGGAIAAMVPSLGRGLLFAALVLFLSYYWLYYRALAIQSVVLLLPIDRRAEAIDLWNQIESKIGAFVRGLALLGLVIAILSAIGYTVIGLPYGLVIAIIGGILEAIPYVGPFLTMLLAIGVGLSVSPTMAALAFAVAAGVQLIESTVVVPRVMDRAVGVRPVVTLLALAIFELLFGLLGALLAVPLAAVFQVLLDRFVLSAPAPEQMDIGGRDRVALLRYQIQDLARDLRQQVRSKTEEADAEVDAAEEELEALLLDLDALLATSQEQRS